MPLEDTIIDYKATTFFWSQIFVSSFFILETNNLSKCQEIEMLMNSSNQVADFINNQTTKQLNNYIWTNRKVETKLYLLPIGPYRIV